VLVERANTDGGAPLLLGRVIRVTPRDPMMEATQTIEISCMPLSMWKLLAPGSVKLAIYVAYFPRIHPPTTGRVYETNINTIRNVQTMPLNASNEAVVSIEIGWGKEQRIFGEGIPVGAYIIDIGPDPDAMDYSYIKISKKIMPLSNFDAARLFDANMQEIENTQI
jgi:hypothetical protein